MTGVLDAETRAAERPGAHRDEVRLWLRLLACSALIEGEIRARLRTRFATTLPRFDLLAQLDRVPQGLTLGDLSRRMMVSNGNLTGLVERLAADGLVERRAHPADRRAALVRLSPAGQARFAVMAAAHAGWLADLFAGLDPDDAAMLMTGLARMKSAVGTAIRHHHDTGGSDE